MISFSYLKKFSFSPSKLKNSRLVIIKVYPQHFLPEEFSKHRNSQPYPQRFWFSSRNEVWDSVFYALRPRKPSSLQRLGRQVCLIRCYHPHPLKLLFIILLSLKIFTVPLFAESKSSSHLSGLSSIWCHTNDPNVSCTIAVGKSKYDQAGPPSHQCGAH